MQLHKLVPLLTLGGVGYAQKDTLAEIAESPLEIANIVRTQVEISSIQRLLMAELVTDGIPREATRDFRGFLRKKLVSNSSRDTSLDPWGNAYQIQEFSDEFQIWSYGPDQIDDTDDDIWAAIPKR